MEFKGKYVGIALITVFVILVIYLYTVDHSSKKMKKPIVVSSGPVETEAPKTPVTEPSNDTVEEMADSPVTPPKDPRPVAESNFGVFGKDSLTTNPIVTSPVDSRFTNIHGLSNTATNLFNFESRRQTGKKFGSQAVGFLPGLSKKAAFNSVYDMF